MLVKVRTRNTLYTLLVNEDTFAKGGKMSIKGDSKRCYDFTEAELLAPLTKGSPMYYRPLEGPWTLRPTHTALSFVQTSTIQEITYE